MPGTLFVVATPIGNLEDVTVRALRVLREVKLIAAEDTRRTAHLLARYVIQTATTSLHEHNETTKAPALIKRLQDGDDVAIVSDAGTPTVSDPGRRLVQSAIQAGVRVESIPGPSALLTALAGSGADSSRFTFLGFPPIKAADRNSWLEELRSARTTVVFFEAPHRIVRTLTDILRVSGDRKVCIGRELTKRHEEFVRGPISRVLSSLSKPIGEFTVVVEFGETTENAGQNLPSEADLATEFGQITIYGTKTRRQAVQQIARKHGLTPNQVYRALEAAKKSGQ